jgi:hypothetical protein
MPNCKKIERGIILSSKTIWNWCGSVMCRFVSFESLSWLAAGVFSVRDVTLQEVCRIYSSTCVYVHSQTTPKLEWLFDSRIGQEVHVSNQGLYHVASTLQWLVPKWNGTFHEFYPLTNGMHFCNKHAFQPFLLWFFWYCIVNL